MNYSLVLISLQIFFRILTRSVHCCAQKLIEKSHQGPGILCDVPDITLTLGGYK